MHIIVEVQTNVEKAVVQLSQALRRETEALAANNLAIEQQKQLAERLEEVSQDLFQEQDRRETLAAEASVKAARLARLEGMIHPDYSTLVQANLVNTCYKVAYDSIMYFTEIQQ